MDSFIENLVYQGFLLISESLSDFLQFPNFHSERAPTIRVGMFNALERISIPSRVSARIFITLDGPSEVGERITIIIKCHTPAKAVPGISCPISIPPNLWTWSLSP